MSEVLSEKDATDLRQHLLDLRRDMLRRLGKLEKHLIPEEALEADSQEQAQQLENEEVLTRLDEASRNELVMINGALSRFESGEYGECAECGESIGLKRLKAIPYAPLCIACASAHEG